MVRFARCLCGLGHIRARPQPANALADALSRMWRLGPLRGVSADALTPRYVTHSHRACALLPCPYFLRGAGVARQVLFCPRLAAGPPSPRPRGSGQLRGRDLTACAP